MNYWWVNQTREYNKQVKDGVIRSTVKSTRGAGKYRHLVSAANKNDIILHYHSKKGIVAVSRAMEKARCIKKRKPLRYAFRSDYREITIDKDTLKESLSFVAKLQRLQIGDGPLLKTIPDFHVRQGYFFPFSEKAYRLIKNLGSRQDKLKWPI